MTFQHIVVIVLLTGAVVYAAYRTWKAFHPADKENPACAGCPIKESCQKRKGEGKPVAGTKIDCKLKN